MRLDQLISQSCGISRKQAKLCVKSKQVTINGSICNSASVHVTSLDSVLFNKQPVQWPHELYYMLNKPAGYCCSHNDDGYPSAMKLLPASTKKMHFAGRLDADTTGLVLVSTDGQWCHRVTSPKQQKEKRKQKHYRVELAEALSHDDIHSLQSGILLKGEKQPTLPARVTLIDKTICDIAIVEGRYHQVKRMFAAINNRVISLHRFQIAEITLDSDLVTGQYRKLFENEISQFREIHD